MENASSITEVRSLCGSLSARMNLIVSAVFAMDGGVAEARGNLTNVQPEVDSIFVVSGANPRRLKAVGARVSDRVCR